MRLRSMLTWLLTQQYRTLVSRIWHDRLLGAVAGAAITLASLWFLLITAATATVILRT